MTSIYIVTHKKTSIPKIEGNYSLLVGASTKSEIVTNFRDDIGNNISWKNPSYCELTGQYWIWKNSNADIVGLCHYRRFLTTNLFSNDPKYFLTGREAEQILLDYDCILPEKIVLKDRVKNSFDEAPSLDDFLELRPIIQDQCPEYLSSYDWYMNQNKTYWYNIFISKKSTYDSYSAWLFPILFEFENVHDMSKETGYRSRLVGMLSERLLDVWIHQNIDDRKIKRLRMARTEEKFIPFQSEFKQVLKNMHYKLKCNLNLQ